MMLFIITKLLFTQVYYSPYEFRLISDAGENK